MYSVIVCRSLPSNWDNSCSVVEWTLEQSTFVIG